MIERIKIGVGVGEDELNGMFRDWVNREKDVIRQCLTGNPEIDVEIVDGWTYLVVKTGDAA